MGLDIFTVKFVGFTIAVDFIDTSHDPAAAVAAAEDAKPDEQPVKVARTDDGEESDDGGGSSDNNEDDYDSRTKREKLAARLSAFLKRNNADWAVHYQSVDDNYDDSNFYCVFKLFSKAAPKYDVPVFRLADVKQLDYDALKAEKNVVLGLLRLAPSSPDISDVDVVSVAWPSF